MAQEVKVKVLAVPGSAAPGKKVATIVHICGPSTGEVDSGSQGLAGPAV